MRSLDRDSAKSNISLLTNTCSNLADASLGLNYVTVTLDNLLGDSAYHSRVKLIVQTENGSDCTITPTLIIVNTFTRLVSLFGRVM